MPWNLHRSVQAQVDVAIGATHLALELIDSRYHDPDHAGFLDNLGDGLLNQGLYLGPQVDTEKTVVAATLMFDVDDDAAMSCQMTGRHPH